MPTRRIAEPSEVWCRHADHEPSNYHVFQPGLYEHECPACGRKLRFRVRGAFIESQRPPAPLSPAIGVMLGERAENNP